MERANKRIRKMRGRRTTGKRVTTVTRTKRSRKMALRLEIAGGADIGCRFWRSEARSGHNLGLVFLSPQLSARRVNVAAAGFSDMGVDAVRSQGFLKVYHVLRT